jgi:ceramide glucosyltransferase
MVTAGLIFLWALGIGGTVWGTWYALREIRQQPQGKDFPAISILKPVKGIDTGLIENLEGFFQLDYPEYEILFSVDSADDPARGVIEGLIARNPQISSRLIIGKGIAAANPKVNNLLESYPLARFETVLISDSNVRVDSSYLKQVVSCLDDKVGIVTAVVAGVGPIGIGGFLEAVYLNTFYARWMYLAQAFGVSTVVGKSMLFKKSVFERLGGLRTFGCYIAEDYMAGKAMYHLGMRVAIMPSPIRQYIGRYSIKNFWQRHLRWGRIRKSHAPIAFSFEPIFMVTFSALLGAVAAQRLHVSVSLFLFTHFFVWFLSDCLLMYFTKTLRRFVFFTWWIRELLAIPLWIHMALGRTVSWRGSRLTLFPGGYLGPYQEPA